jgi:hypothetical protein
MSQERQFEVDGRTYRAGRISTFDQMHVASEWREVLMGLSLVKKNRPPDLSDELYRDGINVVFTGGLARVDPASRENIAKLLLSRVKVQGRGGAEGIGWFSVLAADGSFAYDDIRLSQEVMILCNVVDHNGLLDFFPVGPSTSSGPKIEEETGPRSQTARTGS